MVFYQMQKGQYEFTFQLANLNVREDFALWDNTNKKFLRQIDGVENIADLRFVRKDVFAQRYPNMRKVSQFIRNIIVQVNGIPTLYSFGFRKSANDQILDEIRIRQQLGKDPLDYIYKYRKTGEGLQTNHVVVIMEEVGKPQGVFNPSFASIQPQTPLEQPVISLQVSSGKLSLTPQEQQIVDLFNQDSQTHSEASFVDIFLRTHAKFFNSLADISRLKQIYKEYYQKHKS